MLFATIITFLIDIDKNKGIIPLMFIFLSLYSIFIFIYHLAYNSKVIYKRKKIEFKLVYLIFFIINVALSILSIIVLWM